MRNNTEFAITHSIKEKLVFRNACSAAVPGNLMKEHEALPSPLPRILGFLVFYKFLWGKKKPQICLLNCYTIKVRTEVNAGAGGMGATREHRAWAVGSQPARACVMASAPEGLQQAGGTRPLPGSGCWRPLGLPSLLQLYLFLFFLLEWEGSLIFEWEGQVIKEVKNLASPAQRGWWQEFQLHPVQAHGAGMSRRQAGAAGPELRPQC